MTDVCVRDTTIWEVLAPERTKLTLALPSASENEKDSVPNLTTGTVDTGRKNQTFQQDHPVQHALLTIFIVGDCHCCHLFGGIGFHRLTPDNGDLDGERLLAFMYRIIHDPDWKRQCRLFCRKGGRDDCLGYRVVRGN